MSESVIIKGKDWRVFLFIRKHFPELPVYCLSRKEGKDGE